MTAARLDRSLLPRLRLAIGALALAALGMGAARERWKREAARPVPEPATPAPARAVPGRLAFRLVQTLPAGAQHFGVGDAVIACSDGCSGPPAGAPAPRTWMELAAGTVP